MSSGNVVGLIHDVMPPAANNAQMTVRAGGSTPGERLRVFAFDAATIEYMDYLCELQNYAGGGLTIGLKWSATSATTNVTRWSAAIRRLADDAEDIDTSQTYDFNDVDCTAPTVSGENSYDTITFTNGVDMDSLANGEMFILRIRRNASHANDNMTGDAELWGVPTIKET